MGKCVSLQYDAINPVLCHPKDPLTKLIIFDAHEKCAHMGVNNTLNYVRQGGYWITHGRQAITKVLKKCYVCKPINARSFPTPETTDLPRDRVNLVNPFENTGMDYTGHFLDKDNHKWYILIFTCLNTRAVHLELVPNMAEPEFVLALVQFTNR